MSSRTKSHQFLVNDHVRPTLEILEPDSAGPGFQLAAIVYGDTKEMAQVRAELVSEWLSVEGSRAHLKKSLQVAASYAWACRMYKQGRWPQPFYELLVWLYGCIADRDSVVRWLKEEFK